MLMKQLSTGTNFCLPSCWLSLLSWSGMSGSCSWPGIPGSCWWFLCSKPPQVFSSNLKIHLEASATMNLHVLWITSALDKTFSNFSPSLEEVFQQTRYCRVNSPSTVSTSASAQHQRHIKTTVTNNQANKSNASIPIHINISLRNSPKKGRDIGTMTSSS